MERQERNGAGSREERRRDGGGRGLEDKEANEEGETEAGIKERPDE